MSLRTLTRKTKIDILNTGQDICEMLFETKKSQRACRLFLEYLKQKHGVTRHEFWQFALDLEARKVDPDFSMSFKRFYPSVRRTLLTLGLVAIEFRPDEPDGQELSPERKRRRSVVVSKYVPVWQPITKRPPDGLNLARLCWNICRAWNDEFLPERS